ncbi:triose-phosphate isomerase [Candidatus Woesearchaeota archaeon]|nr:triose-phosphate isomerase [Candidatus Woesearchaeota archaeon]
MKIFVNFKTYKQGSGLNALKLMRKLQKAKTDVTFCLQPGDVHLSNKVRKPVWAQHVDAVKCGQSTGWILPENMKQNGASGVLINHSEHKAKDIGKIVARCKEAALQTMILVPTASEVLKVKKFNPDYIGVEPPDFIGSKTHSVTSKPNIISHAVKNAGMIPLIVGAGIKSEHDIIVAKTLGAKGVLVASAIVKSTRPLEALKKLY